MTERERKLRDVLLKCHGTNIALIEVANLGALTKKRLEHLNDEILAALAEPKDKEAAA